MKKTRKIAMMGLLIALDVVAASYLTIKTPTLKMGLSFLPVSFTGMMFGPLLGGIGAGLADFIQYLLFPMGGYIPGVTLDTLLSGAVYGLLLHKKSPSFLRVLIAVIICEIVISTGLTTLWLSLAGYGPYPVLLIKRLISALIKTPIEIVVIYTVWRLTKKIKIFNY